MINELHPLLENRSDLEKLEKDLNRLAAENDPMHGTGIHQRIQTARRELEIARASQIEMFFQLFGPDKARQAAAYQQLLQRITAGEQKMYDPIEKSWRTAYDLQISYKLKEEQITQAEARALRFEAELQNAADNPRKLRVLQETIKRAEDLSSVNALSVAGQAVLQKARSVCQEIEAQHQKILLQSRTASLNERYRAVEMLQNLIAAGESEIFEAPAQIWHPIQGLLIEAIKNHQEESTKVAAALLKKAEDLLATEPDRSLHVLYLGLDKSIAYTQSDRDRLEAFYLERRHERSKQTTNLPPTSEPIAGADLEGFKKIRDARREELFKLFNNSAKWMDVNHLTLTREVGVTLAYAGRKDVALVKTIDLIDAAISQASRQMAESLEIPGAMVQGAIILFNKNEATRARELLSQALPLYKRDRKDILHRHAVTEWLLGCVEYSMGNRLSGHHNWNHAQNEFVDLKEKAIDARPTYWKTWYKDHLKEMDLVRVETVELIYFRWLDQFGPLHVPAWFAQYRDLINDKFKKNQIPQLRATLQDMLRDASREVNPEYTWLAQLEAAFFEYQMNDFNAAITHLDQARVGFHFEHRHAVILWMVGLLRWWLPSQRPDAILNWNQSIQLFKDLAKQADEANKQDKRIWYEAQVDLMVPTLKKWIQLTNP